MADFVNQPYKVIGRNTEYTNETSTFDTAHEVNYQNHLWGAKFASDSIVIGAGMPIVWQDEDTKAVSVLQLATVTGLTSKTFTVTADEEDRFNEGDAVYVATKRFDDIEYCGVITSINTTTHAIAVTATPTITAGYLYVNTDKTNVLTASTSVATKVVTLTDTGASYNFSVGDLVYETATDGSGIADLGAVTVVSHSDNKITVTETPSETSGGFIGINYGLPEIVGINAHYVSNVTDYKFGTTFTADTQCEYTVQCEVFDNSLDWYSGSKLVVDKLKVDCPNVIVSTNQNNGGI